MNLPAPFTEYTRALLGNEEYEKLAVALQQEPPVSIRLNEKLGALSQNAGAAHSSFFILKSPYFLRQIPATDAPFLRIKIIGPITDILHKSERNIPVSKQYITARGCFRQGDSLFS